VANQQHLKQYVCARVEYPVSLL